MRHKVRNATTRNRRLDVPDTREPSIAPVPVELAEAELKQVTGGLYSPYPPTHLGPKPPVPGTGCI